jgi:hypothetical protein
MDVRVSVVGAVRVSAGSSVVFISELVHKPLDLLKPTCNFTVHTVRFNNLKFYRVIALPLCVLYGSRNVLSLLDFKLSPCSECHMLSSL